MFTWFSTQSVFFTKKILSKLHIQLKMQKHQDKPKRFSFMGEKKHLNKFEMQHLQRANLQFKCGGVQEENSSQLENARSHWVARHRQQLIICRMERLMQSYVARLLHNLLGSSSNWKSTSSQNAREILQKMVAFSFSRLKRVFRLSSTSPCTLRTMAFMPQLRAICVVTAEFEWAFDSMGAFETGLMMTIHKIYATI